MFRDGNAAGSIGDSANAGDSTGDLEQSIFICDGPRITRVQPLFQLRKNPDPIFFSKDYLILRSHGLLTTGRSVAEGFTRMYYLNKACEIAKAVRLRKSRRVFAPSARFLPDRARSQGYTILSYAKYYP